MYDKYFFIIVKNCRKWFLDENCSLGIIFYSLIIIYGLWFLNCSL